MTRRQSAREQAALTRGFWNGVAAVFAIEAGIVIVAMSTLAIAIG